MKPGNTISCQDYKRACFILNNINTIMPGNSTVGKSIIQAAEKIIMLYMFQKNKTNEKNSSSVFITTFRNAQNTKSK